MQLRNNRKCTQTLCNTPKHEFMVQWGRLGAFVEKNPVVTSWQELLHQLHQFTLFCVEFRLVTKRSQMHPNTMQHTKTWVYGPMGPIRCVRCEKLQCDFVARTFAIIAPVNPFAPSFVQLRYDTKCTRTLWNDPKHEFRVQWDASSAFVAKNYVTLWYELLH